MSFDFKNTKIYDCLFSAEFGLEKECMRITPEGFPAHTRHPFGRSRFFQKDFCENQVEFITDVFESPKQVCSRLYSLHSMASYTLDKLCSGRELLWPFSNPPYVKGEEDVPVADFRGKLKNKALYREYLARKYGKMQMLYSGIHLNFSFSKKLLGFAFIESGQDDFKEFKNSAYLELAKKLTNYSWLIVYLTAASPVVDGSLFDKSKLGETVITKYSSLRCSEIGYWNDFVPVLDYTSLDLYIKSVQRYINEKKLRSVSELYYPVRLKPEGVNSLDNLREKGINHVELRMLDINPFSPTGVAAEDIEFIHLLIVYLMFQRDSACDGQMQLNAVSNEKTAALLADNAVIFFDGKTDSVKNAAERVLNDLEGFYRSFNDEKIMKTIRFQKEKITLPGKRYAQRVIDKFGDSYVKNGLLLADSYAEQLLNSKNI